MRNGVRARDDSRLKRNAKMPIHRPNEWSNWGGSGLLWTQAAERLARRGVKVVASVPDFCKPLPQGKD